MEKIKLFEHTPYRIAKCELPDPVMTAYTDGCESESCVIILPGGAYVCHADHEGSGYAKYLNSIGVKAFVLNYRVYPNCYPSMVLDVRRAVRYVKQNADKYKIDPDKILVMGSSAGGHLAAISTALMDKDVIDECETIEEIDRISPTVAGVILSYPVITFGPLGHDGTANVFTDNGRYDKAEFSVENAVHEGYPPTFIWHTFTDESVDIRNPLMLASRIKEIGGDCEMHVYSFGHHGLGLAEDDESVSQWSGQLKTWLKIHDFLPKK